jgi:hypothetical protein
MPIFDGLQQIILDAQLSLQPQFVPHREYSQNVPTNTEYKSHENRAGGGRHIHADR